MKKVLVVLVLLLCAVGAQAQSRYHVDTTCLRLYFPDSLRNAKYNPDSVMKDTCQQGLQSVWIKRGFMITFSSLELRLPWAPGDSILEVPWTAIDTAYGDEREVFQQLFDSVGPYVFRKLSPTDTFSVGSYEFGMHFFQYVPSDTVLRYLRRNRWISIVGPDPLVPGGNGVSHDKISEQDNAFTVFPDPATTWLRIAPHSGSLPTELAEVFNGIGQQISDLAIRTEGTSWKLDISHLENGLYFVRIGGATSRFVVGRFN